jgi:hypothetical protein
MDADVTPMAVAPPATYRTRYVPIQTSDTEKGFAVSPWCLHIPAAIRRLHFSKAAHRGRPPRHGSLGRS